MSSIVVLRRWLMRLARLNFIRFVSLGLISLCLHGCVPTPVNVNSGDPYLRIDEKIQPATSNMGEVRTLLGEPYLSNEEWGVDIFHGNSPATIYTVLWVYPIWVEADQVDEYLMVTYSEQGVVTGIRSYEGGHCDFKCGEKLKVGNFKGLDLYVSGKKVILLASKEDSARLLSTEPEADECAVYLVSLSGLPVYLDQSFVQYSLLWGFFRLLVTPGDHTVTTYIEDDRDVDSNPGRQLGEAEHRGQSTWTFSCGGGTTVYAFIGNAQSSIWRLSTLHSTISSIPESDAKEALQDRPRMIIPFDRGQSRH